MAAKPGGRTLKPAVASPRPTPRAAPSPCPEPRAPARSRGRRQPTSAFRSPSSPPLNDLVPGLPRTAGILLRRPCQHGAMATIEELLSALDERLLDAIGGKSTPEGVAKLAEARAWLTNPDQPHGSTVTS